MKSASTISGSTFAALVLACLAQSPFWAHSQFEPCVEVRSRTITKVVRPLDREPGEMRRVGGTAPESQTEKVVQSFKKAFAADALKRIRRCYERQLQNDPATTEAVYVMQAVVSPMGLEDVEVVAKKMTSWHRSHGDLSACMSRAIRPVEPSLVPRCGTVVIRWKIVFVRPE